MSKLYSQCSNLLRPYHPGGRGHWIFRRCPKFCTHTHFEPHVARIGRNFTGWKDPMMKRGGFLISEGVGGLIVACINNWQWHHLCTTFRLISSEIEISYNYCQHLLSWSQESLTQILWWGIWKYWENHSNIQRRRVKEMRTRVTKYLTQEKAWIRKRYQIIKLLKKIGQSKFFQNHN